ncbi:MAG TPA: class I SAM-dependent methyltransferase [Terriglobales bacterium]|nr:class I SAM-dependent methyltransferase [Terriglobales bacterium]
MLDKFTALTSDLYAYLADHRSDRDPLLDELKRETEGLGGVAMMQIAPEQGALMTLLVRAIEARRAIEIGTFTGYSALSIARGLPDDGLLVCCDINPEWTAIGRRYWDRAGVGHKVELRLGPALETLAAMPPTPAFDFAFIDADKTNYRNYYEALLPRVRQNGLLVFDNVLWMGQVLDGASSDESTVALRQLNDRLRDDPRVESVMLSISDGITIARKR